MLDKTSDIAISAESWLAEFEAALTAATALDRLVFADPATARDEAEQAHQRATVAQQADEYSYPRQRLQVFAASQMRQSSSTAAPSCCRR